MCVYIGYVMGGNFVRKDEATGRREGKERGKGVGCAYTYIRTGREWLTRAELST